MEIFNNTINFLNNAYQCINKKYLPTVDRKVAYAAIEPFIGLGIAFSGAVIVGYFIHRQSKDPDPYT